jgi:bifunctional UDP-N-acetylglucosamine pyrophosphorylase/glucosamine-1-phosphate N-acetyltransferase
MPKKNLQIDQNKLREKFLNKGIKMIAPETIFFSKETVIGKNVTIEPYVVFSKKVKIGNNVIVKSFSHLEGVIVENNVEIGPYARIRPEVRIQKGSKIGNFVEIKNSKVNHLSYIGDTTIGKNVNIGAGTITCNYDGVKKSKTNIKDGVFIGSNSSLVAPVTINKSSIVGASSVITKDVLPKSLALTRSNQITIKNYKRKK